MNDVVSQDFWCTTLDGKNQSECLWEHQDEDISHHLIVEQIVLGSDAKKPCLVEVTARVASGEEKSTMICHLIPGVFVTCNLSLGFKEKAKFRLVGDGPVYIAGTHSQSVEDMEEDSDDEGAPGLISNKAAVGDEDEESSEGSEEEVDEDAMLEQLEAARQNKLKTFMKKDKRAMTNSKPGPLSKKSEEPATNGAAKVEEIDSPAVAEEKEEEMDAEDDDEESSDEDDEEGDDDDDDDDDDDEDVESDDEEIEEDDSDDEDEDDSEESPEEEEPTPANKKRKTENAAVAVKANGKAAPKAAAKPAESTPKGKKQDKKPQTPVAKPDINELKKKLMASPNLPKKYDKFANLMKNAHKITDDKEIKSTWEFLQKSKK